MSELENVIAWYARASREQRALLSFYLPRLEDGIIPVVPPDHFARINELAAEMKRLHVRIMELWEGQKTDSAAQRLGDLADDWLGARD